MHAPMPLAAPVTSADFAAAMLCSAVFEVTCVDCTTGKHELGDSCVCRASVASVVKPSRWRD